MALIFPDSRCAICGGTLDRPYTATSGVPFISEPRLQGYYDAPLHLDCLAGWANREEFSRGKFVSRLATHWWGYGTLLIGTAEWFLACGPGARSDLTLDPAADPHFARVELASWPFPLYSKWSEWDAFVDGGFRADLTGPALDAATAVMTEVREQAPSVEALRSLRGERLAQAPAELSLVEFGRYLETLWGMAARRINWRMLEQTRVASEAAEAERRRERAERIGNANAMARRLVIKLANGGHLKCPHCRRVTREARFIDRGPETESYFVCKLCGRSFSGSEGSDALARPC